MQRTYIFRCKYDIIACEKDEYPSLYDPMSISAIRKFRKEHPDKLEKALEKLSSDHMCYGENLKGKAYKEHLAKCFIPGVIAAKIKYKHGGWANVSITFDHEPTENELIELDDAMEGQMVDGYGENPFELFTIDDITYYLTI